uniref:ribonuclease H n=1 Tax=Malurus cyaneus samueli TaxID=2593467 RepID=A0A8C5TGM6_9PASS
VKLGKEDVELLVDTGATYSVLNTLKGKLSHDTVNVIGATGASETRPFFQPLKFKLGKHWVTHQFLYMPNFPKPLLGRDLLEKLEVEIKFSKEEGVKVIIPESKFVEAATILIQECCGEIPKEVEDAVIPIVWANGFPGRFKRVEPVNITLKTGATLVRQIQYPLKLEGRRGLALIIEKFLEFGFLVECESKYNTPILPVKKADGKSYRLVQDLREINKITEDIHSVVANPSTFLTTLTNELGWFTVLDLKDAFFSILVHKNSQELFAFEWENPDTGRKTQLTWTVLPQGFKNSPTIFGNQLAKELEDWQKQESGGTVLQYVDDILIAAKTRDDCIQLTVSLLNFLGLGGYRVSKEKAQIAKETVVYLGLEIFRGHRQLRKERKEAICRLSRTPHGEKMQGLLGNGRLVPLVDIKLWTAGKTSV